MNRLANAWNRFWFAPASPVNLGLCRLLLFAGLLSLYGPVDFAAWARVDSVFYHPIKVLGLLAFSPASPPVMEALQWAFRLALLLATLGLLTRFATLAAFLLGFYLLGIPIQFGRLEHVDGLMVILMGILGLSRCGDAWSLDNLIKRHRQKTVLNPTPDARYRWPIKAAQLALASVFFAAGIAKIRNGGLEWITSDTFAWTLTKAQYTLGSRAPVTDWGLWVAHQRWLCLMAASGAIFVETLYPLALFWRRSRWFFIPATVLMLIGFRLLIGPWFGTFILAHLFWIPWTRWAPSLLPAQAETPDRPQSPENRS